MAKSAQRTKLARRAQPAQQVQSLPTQVTVLGDGSWGTAMALVLRRHCHVKLWSAFKEQADAMRKDNENKSFLPGHPLDSVVIVDDRKEAIEDAELIFVAIPSRYLRQQMRLFAKLIKARMEQLRQEKKKFFIVSLTKGFENKTWLLPTQIIEDVLGVKKMVMALSGPSHAEEVAKSIPTVVTLAGSNKKDMVLLQGLLSLPRFRIYTNSDIVGVQIGAAIKNVIAIAGGMCAGMGFGSNTLAALVTRGIKEMSRFSVVFGGKKQTLYGLAGIGDLIVTCFSEHSRNYRLGFAIAKGKTLQEYTSSTKMVSEGVQAVYSVYHYAKKKGLYMPITQMVYLVLYKQQPLDEAVNRLMTAPQKDEFI